MPLPPLPTQEEREQRTRDFKIAARFLTAMKTTILAVNTALPLLADLYDVSAGFCVMSFQLLHLWVAAPPDKMQTTFDRHCNHFILRQRLKRQSRQTPTHDAARLHRDMWLASIEAGLRCTMLQPFCAVLSLYRRKRLLTPPL